MAKKLGLHSHILRFSADALNTEQREKHQAMLVAFEQVLAAVVAMGSLAQKRRMANASTARIASLRGEFESAMLGLRDALNSLMDTVGTSPDDRGVILRSWEAHLEQVRTRYSTLLRP